MGRFSMKRRHSEGDIGRDDGENLPESKRVERSPKYRGRGRPPRKNKTGNTEGNTEDPDLPNASRTIMQEKLTEDAKLMEEENKINKERDKNNKRNRSPEKDKDKEEENEEEEEDLPKSKKSKKSPMVKINLKKMSINSGGKSNGYLRLYKKKNGEKCIFCQEEYFQENLCEDMGREKPNILQVPICSSCHACLKDDVVMKEIREIVKKKQF